MAVASLIAAAVIRAALIRDTWTIGRGIPDTVAQSRPGFALHKGQTKVIGLMSSVTGSLSFTKQKA